MKSSRRAFQHKAALEATLVVWTIAGFHACAWSQLLSTEPVRSSQVHWTRGIAVGDVDGDGALDLALGNHRESSTLYRNVGGLFSTDPVWSSPVGYTSNMAFGDVDGDGDLDLVCAESEDPTGNRTTLYLNQGGELEAAPVWSSRLDQTHDVALGDVDGDGDLDLVCGNNTLTTLYLNDGGRFGDGPVWTSWLNHTFAVALGDVDGDGDLDLVCGNKTEATTLYLGEGGVFGVAPVWESQVHGTNSIDLGDVDGDGDLDLVIGPGGTVAGEPNLTVLYRNEGGRFGVTPVWSTSADAATYAVVLGDVDGDGDLDLVVGNRGARTELYANEGGDFGSAPVWVSQDHETQDAVLADVNGDGGLDLICGNRLQSATLYLNTGTSFDTTPDWSSPVPSTWIALATALGDIDGDADLDLLLGLSQGILVHRNVNGDFGPAIGSFGTGGTRAIVPGDVDLDGDIDVVIGAKTGSTLVVLLYANQSGSFTYVWSSLVDTSEFADPDVALGDVNADGWLDLVVGTPNRGARLHLNAGGRFSDEPVWSSAAPYQFARHVALGDVDGDGRLDLVCALSSSAGVAIFRGDGLMFDNEPMWSWRASTSVGHVTLGDVNGDGWLDLVCGTILDSVMLFINSSGRFTDSPVWASPTAHEWPRVVLSDVNGDGRLDLVMSSRGNNKTNTLYLNEGVGFGDAPAWRSQIADAPGIAVGDVDRDGDPDLVCANYDRPTTLYRGRSSYQFQGGTGVPANHLPNNDAFIAGTFIAEAGENRYRIDFVAADVETDPVWVVADYQFRGDPRWAPVEVLGTTGRLGPFATTITGSGHRFTWDTSRVPVDSRPVVLRLRALSNPGKVGVVQRVPSYRYELGPIDVRRPMILASLPAVDFPRVTVGDTVEASTRIVNRGNEMLSIERLVVPGFTRVVGELQTDIAPGDGMDLLLSFEPLTALAAAETLWIDSNDPATPRLGVPLQRDVREIQFIARLLASTPEVPVGQALTAVVTPAAEVRIERADIRYRQAGSGAAFVTRPLQKVGGDFIGTIPNEGVTEGGVEYSFAVENSNVIRTHPADGSWLTQAVHAPDAVTSHALQNSSNGFLAGRSISVEVRLPEGAQFVQGMVHYRRGGESSFHAAMLQGEPPALAATIPDSAVTERGLEYWVEAQTLTSVLTDPASDAALAPHTLRLIVQRMEEPLAHAGAAYRMVSIPLDFGEGFSGSLEALLAELPAFGSYDPLRWRSFRWLPERECTADAYACYVELGDDEASTVRPGRAFWLVTKETHRVQFQVPGQTASTQERFALQLQPGWNQIGNPFAFPVAWDAITIDSLTDGRTARVEPPWRWNASTEGRGAYENAAVLEPFDGYFVVNNSPEPATLRIPALAAAPMLADGIAAKATSAAAGRVVSDFDIAIRVTAGGFSDAAHAGLVAGAAKNWDARDRSDPPAAPGGAVSIYFPHDDWDTVAHAFCRDTRPLAHSGASDPVLVGGGEAWRFDVARKGFAPGTELDAVLTVEGIANLPSSLEAVLLDHVLGSEIDLRHETQWRFVLGERGMVDEAVARFELVIGDAEFLGSHREGLLAFPLRTRLLPNQPNPFRVGTTIRYEIASDVQAALRIYDVRGRLVRTLVQGSARPGRYELVWDGTDARAHVVPGGVYFTRLETLGAVQTRKILFVR